MGYDFTPLQTSASSTGAMTKLDAIVLFRQATKESIGNSKHFIETNLEPAPGTAETKYSVRDVGNLIRAYYELQH